jgi:hypothetical protein
MAMTRRQDASPSIEQEGPGRVLGEHGWYDTMTGRLGLMALVAITYCGAAEPAQSTRNSYDVLLRSSLLSQQRVALATVLAMPGKYAPRIAR